MKIILIFFFNRFYRVLDAQLSRISERSRASRNSGGPLLFGFLVVPTFRVSMEVWLIVGVKGCWAGAEHCVSSFTAASRLSVCLRPSK